MKVNPEQVRALQEAEAGQRPRQAKEGDGSFGDLLAREVEKGAQAASAGVSSAASSAPPLGGIGIYGVEAVSGVSDVQQAGQQVMANLEGILSEWENYADQLKAPDGEVSLRNANDALVGIENGVQRIKDQWPNLPHEAPALQSMVEELEVLAVTERFKFNRGDYLA